MSNSTRILLAERSDARKETILAALNECSDLRVVGTAKTIKKALSCTSLRKPDVLFLDIGLLTQHSSELCKELRDLHPSLKIVMTTDSKNEEEVFAALASGADGYCLKELNAAEIKNGLRTMRHGDFWLDSQIGKCVIRSVELCLSRLKHSEQKQQHESEALSQREIEVLSLISLGLSNQEIAENLSISPETVKSHISNMIKKLSVKDRTQAAVKAVREGLI